MNANSPKSKTAVIVGNGTTRKAFNLSEFRKQGPIFGCNALYREFEPDWLVAIDDKIVNEILSSNFPKEKFIITPFEEQFEPAVFNPYQPRNNAGMIAMDAAIKRGYNDLICIGFDFLIADEALNASNIYDGTSGYGPETRGSLQDCINRTYFLDWFASHHPDVTFTFLFPIGEYQFRSLNAQNVHGGLVQISS